jgi:hypothetical protein
VWTKGINSFLWSLGLKYQPKEKASTIAYYLENQFTPHYLCDGSHKQRVDARVQALLEVVDDTIL